MTERSEADVTVGCSPRNGEPVTGAPHIGERSESPQKWMVHQ